MGRKTQEVRNTQRHGSQLEGTSSSRVCQGGGLGSVCAMEASVNLREKEGGGGGGGRS